MCPLSPCVSGVLHLTPISAVCRFKPQLGYIDDAAAAAAASSDVAREAHRAERLSQGRMTEDEEIEMEEEEDLRIKEEEKKKELQTVVMKVDRKKGAAAAAAGANGAAGAGGAAGGAMPMRKQTYAYIKQLEENEKWIPLKLHEQEVRGDTDRDTTRRGKQAQAAHRSSCACGVRALCVEYAVSASAEPPGASAFRLSPSADPVQRACAALPVVRESPRSVRDELEREHDRDGRSAVPVV